MNFDPRAVYVGSDGELTKAFYRELNSRSIHGELATALFRAQKRSSAAKKYRGRKYKSAAYDVKGWSLSEICRILSQMDKLDLEPKYSWGWKRDPNTPGFEWVLFVELEQGQCSFHSADRLTGPDYTGDWDGTHVSADRIIAFCEQVLATEPSENGPHA